MCLIIHRPDGAVIPDSYLSNGIQNNPDGWGLVVPGKHPERGLHAKEFFDAYDRTGGSEVYIHFRFATHGLKDVANCHPFDILNGRYTVLHNGVIPIPIEDASKSDTWHFCQRYLAPKLHADPTIFGTEPFERELGSLVKGSKLVIVRSDGASMIANRADGSNLNGLWLSNTYSVEPSQFEREPSRFGFGRWDWEDERDAYRAEYDPATATLDEIATEEQWTLESLEALEEHEISDICAQYPDLMAGLIREHFDSFYETKRVRSLRRKGDCR